MDAKMFLNSLIGTYSDKNKYYFEIYDIFQNNNQKELMNKVIFEKDILNNINLKSDIIIKNEAYCLDCKTNVNLCETPNCKNHNVKYLKDLNKDINIESIENNFKKAVENYEKMLKYMEEEFNNFKKRNANQILLAKKIIEAYKLNINNLNYQIILNAKNVLNFNDINYKLIIQDDLPINFEYNILKEFPISNYVKEKISI